MITEKTTIKLRLPTEEQAKAAGPCYLERWLQPFWRNGNNYCFWATDENGK